MRTRANGPVHWIGVLAALALMAALAWLASGCASVERYERLVARTPWYATNLYTPVVGDGPREQKILTEYVQLIKTRTAFLIAYVEPPRPGVEGFLDEPAGIIYINRTLSANAKVLAIAHGAAHLFLPTEVVGREAAEVFAEYVSWRVGRALGLRTTLGYVAHVKMGLPILRSARAERERALHELIP